MITGMIFIWETEKTVFFHILGIKRDNFIICHTYISNLANELICNSKKLLRSEPESDSGTKIDRIKFQPDYFSPIFFDVSPHTVPFDIYIK